MKSICGIDCTNGLRNSVTFLNGAKATGLIS